MTEYVTSSSAFSQMPSYTISHQAYVKIRLHVAKHPHKAVNGVLIGKKGKAREDSVAILDAIPLLHLWTTLSPMMEVGLELVCFSSFQGTNTLRKYISLIFR